MTFINAGTAPHAMQFLRLNADVTLDQLFAVGQQAGAGDRAAQAQFMQMVTASGGVQQVGPGQTQSVVVTLAEGTNIVIDLRSANNGLVKPIQVSGATSDAVEPPTDVAVALKEYSFDTPLTVKTGPTTFKLTDTGTQSHEMVLAKLDDGYTLDDVKAQPIDGGPPSWAQPAPSAAMIAPGTSETLTLDLTPGVYALLCFVTDPATGRPHAALGMTGTFTAQ